jgi:hypothetical protein
MEEYIAKLAAYIATEILKQPKRTIRPEEALRQIAVRTDDSAALDELRTKALHRPESSDHAWWWDISRE